MESLGWYVIKDVREPPSCMCLQVPWTLGCRWEASASAEKRAPLFAQRPTCLQTARSSADFCRLGK